MATPSGEVAQRLASTISKQVLNTEVQAALLRLGTRPEYPENNLRELINNYLKCKWIECPTKRQRLTEWLQKKNLYMLSTRDPPQNKGHI